MQPVPSSSAAETAIDDRMATAEVLSLPVSGVDSSREHFPVQSEPFGKRLIDLALGSLMLAVSSPAWLLIGLAIKLEDGGPVFYRQTRWGRGGRTFDVLKFRTMAPDSDHRFGVRQARAGDDRITRIGHFLRRFGLDELPQILSIVKGDMSFVGPRPLAVGEIVTDGRGQRVHWEDYDGFARRLAVRPGLTSLATIFLPKDAHPRRKFRYDLLYVRRHRLSLDVRLIAFSFWISFRGRWESRQNKL